MEENNISSKEVDKIHGDVIFLIKRLEKTVIGHYQQSLRRTLLMSALNALRFVRDYLKSAKIYLVEIEKKGSTQ